MKNEGHLKPSIKAILLTSTYILLINSCRKSEHNPSDFRDKYIGLYQVHETISSYGFPECGEPFSRELDTVISVTYGNADSTLDILGRNVYLDSAGRYSEYHFELRLWNDSIYSYFKHGGLGCGQNEVFEGYKITN